MATNFQLWNNSDSSYSSSYDSSGSSGEEANNLSDNAGAKVDLSYQSMDSDVLEVHLQELDGEDNRRRDRGNLEMVQRVHLFNNQLTFIPPTLTTMKNVTHLDLSNNTISSIPESITELKSLTHLYLRNNSLTDSDFPKELKTLRVTLRDLNVSGNRFTTIPPPLMTLHGLRNLFIGGNRITSIPSEVKVMKRLRVLYLGGNFLKHLPTEISQLSQLVALILADNQLESLPDSVCDLKRLQCLQLHRNRLTTLPHNLVFLKGLRELSLRDNPLVVRFVREMTFQPSSLLELAARVVRVNRLEYEPWGLPKELRDYMIGAHKCLNPNCQGVYFDSKVEHVKFVDFCGKYRVPLMQYLCSSRCHADNPAVGQVALPPELESRKMRRVLLG